MAFSFLIILLLMAPFKASHQSHHSSWSSQATSLAALDEARLGPTNRHTAEFLLPMAEEWATEDEHTHPRCHSCIWTAILWWQSERPSGLHMGLCCWQLHRNCCSRNWGRLPTHGHLCPDEKGLLPQNYKLWILRTCSTLKLWMDAKVNDITG